MYLTLFLWTDICLEIETKLEIVYASAVVLAIFFIWRGGGVFFHLINAQRKPCLVLKLAWLG